METVKKKVNLSAFIDSTGRIVRLPAPNRTKLPVLAYLAGKFEEDRIYNEKEINGIINAWHTFGDYFILRRLLVDYGFLGRTPDGARYWPVKAEEREEGES
ncbi:MAG TPA: DUF2087 domain-containing protein [Clostridia bacterium]|nr:DUF2087 domain-containing protein [Clostridia bacterium]